MKNLYIAILLLLFSCGDSEKEKASKEYDNNAAIAELKTNPNVLDAYITDANVLYVQADGNGVSYEAFACNLCEILKRRSSTVGMAKIVLAGSQNNPNRDNAYGVLLGQCMCK